MQTSHCGLGAGGGMAVAAHPGLAGVPVHLGGEDVCPRAVNCLHPRGEKAGAKHFRFICHCWQALGLGGMQAEGRTWACVPPWSEALGVGGFDLGAANRGAYGGLVHGIASCPKPPPTPKPQAAPPSNSSSTPTTPRMPS